MKQLITVLIFLAGYFNLFGQSAPMVVAGKVYIGEATLRSQGTVHIHTSANPNEEAGKINIAGENGQLVADTIIFYSNERSDGLLKNSKGVVKGTASNDPKAVILRKGFVPNTHTYLSFPFDVDKVYKKGTLTEFKGGYQDSNIDEYRAYEFDGKTRAEYNTKSDVWKEIGTPPRYDKDKGVTYVPNINYANSIKKGTGYQFIFGSIEGEQMTYADFYAKDYDIPNLFRKVTEQKNAQYTAYKGSQVFQEDEFVDASNGWAFIGTLNTYTFPIKGGSEASITGALGLYYRKTNDSKAENSQWYGVLLANSIDENIHLGPYTPFYIQFPSTGMDYGEQGQKTLTFKAIDIEEGFESIAYRSSRSESNQIKDNLYFALSSKDDKKDRFYMQFADTYTEAYSAEKDMEKWEFDYRDCPTVWSLRKSLNLDVNGLPSLSNGNERIVKIGFSVPEAGEYTISLQVLSQNDVNKVVLLDSQTGKMVDLLQESQYSFSTEKVTGNNERFVLHINPSPTGVPTLKADEVFAYVKDNILTVKNLGEGDKVRVLDLTGRTVASGKAFGREFSVLLGQKGVYVVNVGGKSSVIKVLNK